MRIAMLAHTNSPWTPHYARHFQSAGHEVRVLSFTPDPLEGVEVTYLGKKELPGLLKPLRFAAQIPRVRRALRHFRPDAVLATYLSSNGMTAALCWRGPLIVSARGGDVLRQAGYLPGGALLHAPMIRFVCGRATIVHAVSQEIVDALVACGVPAKKIVSFPMGVDVDSFMPRGNSRSAPGPVHIVCTRSQDSVYANDVVVQGLHWLRQRGHAFRCTLAGGGPLLEERQAQVRQLGLADVVTFTGQVTLETIRSLLASADIYVSASTSDGTSSSLLEAMASGVFPVVSRIRANEPWIRPGETGLFFEAGDASDLGRQLEIAMGDAPLRDLAAASNRALVQRGGNQRVSLERMLELVHRAVGGSSGR
jgi:L-malate glycosyltransferase